MTRKSKSLTGREVRLKKEIDADWRDQREQLQDKQFVDKSQTLNHGAYQRAVRRACIDAFVLLKDFPARLRFSYFVDRNGCLRCAREQGGQR